MEYAVFHHEDVEAPSIKLIPGHEFNFKFFVHDPKGQLRGSPQTHFSKNPRGAPAFRNVKSQLFFCHNESEAAYIFAVA